MSVFEVFLVRIFSHLDWIRTRKILNTDTFRAPFIIAPQKLYAFKPILCHWSLSIPSEIIKKQEMFWCFQRVYKETGDIKWVKNKNLTSKHSYGFKKTIMAKLVEKQCNNFLILFIHKKFVFFYPSKTNIIHHIETSQVIYWFLYDGEHWSLLG